MKTTNVLKHDIARVEAALKSGALKAYAPAQSLSENDAQTQRSWGPAMRR